MSDNSDVNIKWDWLPAADIKAPELRATWARVEIYLGPHCVTLVEDVESSSSRRSIFVPLYPLAEWIVFNWWFLLANSRPATLLSHLPLRQDIFLEPAAKSHRERHGLRSAGDGFIWPNLLILPEGKTTRLVWRADPAHDGTAPVRYLTSGEVTVGSAIIRHRLGHIVDAVLARLLELGIRDSTLETEWLAVQNADEDETEYCIAAARLGLDPYSEAHEHTGEILKVAETLSDPDMLGDFLDAVEPSRIDPTLEWVARTHREIETLNRGQSDLASLKGSLKNFVGDQVSHWNNLPPWEVGWEQARLVRTALGISDTDEFAAEERMASTIRPGPTRNLQAVGGVTDPALKPLVVLSHQQYPASKRFTLARAMWHVLWQGSGPFLITSAHTHRQKVERAFAAELLAPISGIASKLSGDLLGSLDDEALDDVATSFGVSPILVRHQVDNQLSASPR